MPFGEVVVFFVEDLSEDPISWLLLPCIESKIALLTLELVVHTLALVGLVDSRGDKKLDHLSEGAIEVEVLFDVLGSCLMHELDLHLKLAFLGDLKDVDTTLV